MQREKSLKEKTEQEKVLLYMGTQTQESLGGPSFEVKLKKKHVKNKENYLEKSDLQPIINSTNISILCHIGNIVSTASATTQNITNN